MTKNVRGQVLIMAVMIVLILIISVPLVVILNQVSSQLGKMSRNRHKGTAIAEEGVAFAVHRLSSPTAWNDALSGSFPPEFGVLRTTSKGGQYRLDATTGGSLEVYQVRLVSTAYEKNKAGDLQPVRTLEAILSRKTLGINLPPDRQASAALQLNEPPDVVGNLDVHWGPMVCASSSSWTIIGTMDQQQYPRKFSQGPITGTVHERAPAGSNPPFSDQQEYWAFASVGFPPVMDDNYYLWTSTKSMGVTPCDSCTAVPPGSGHFINAVGVSTFTGTGGTDYTVSSSTDVILVEGNAFLARAAIDLKQNATASGAFIVQGDLHLGHPGNGIATFTPPIRSVPTAFLEYPFTTVPTTPPPRVQLRGFLYVKGDLVVEQGQWVIMGSVQVDGKLRIPAGSRLTIYYDDEVNRTIQTSTFELKIDSLREISPT